MISALKHLFGLAAREDGWRAVIEWPPGSRPSALRPFQSLGSTRALLKNGHESWRITNCFTYVRCAYALRRSPLNSAGPTEPDDPARGGPTLWPPFLALAIKRLRGGLKQTLVTLRFRVRRRQSTPARRGEFAAAAGTR